MAENATPEGERIAKVLSRAGVASRREAERLIELGEVTVNGRVITSPALNVTAADRIMVSGKPVGAPEPARLWLYYKPEGLVTSESDEKGRDTVFANLPPDMPRVMSVGRLDLNSEGLLLLTNDGALKRRLELPSTGWLRKYRVRVNGNPMDPDLDPLRKGIVVDGEKFQPMNVVLDRIQGANAWLTVGLREGKNREIRRAMSAIGLTVNRLIRISYGPFRLNEMKPGDVEEIKPRILKEQLGLTDPEEAAPRGRPARAGAGAKPARPAATRAKAGEAAPPASRRPGTGSTTATGSGMAKTSGPRGPRAGGSAAGGSAVRKTGAGGPGADGSKSGGTGRAGGKPGPRPSRPAPSGGRPKRGE